MIAVLMMFPQRFRDARTEGILVDGIYDKNSQLITSMSDDAGGRIGHGTAMAGLINEQYGIAPQTTVIGVKFMGNGRSSPRNLRRGWRLAIEDARTKNRLGKTVFVTAVGKSLSGQMLDQEDINQVTNQAGK